MLPHDNAMDKVQHSTKNSKKQQNVDEKAAERERQKQIQTSDMPTKDEPMIRSVTESYNIGEELGRGSFGAVYRVKRVSDSKSYAMKCESVHVKKQILAHEAKVLQSLNLLKSVHFVQMIDRGKVPNRFLFIILRLVGKNLWDLRTQELPNKKFTLNTALKIAVQTLAGIRDLHRVGYLHRDIKPPNFAIGRECDNAHHIVYVLDFGLCRKICHKGVDLRTPREHCAFRGTTRYASMAAHEGKEQSRKDDLEAWWYMICEMIIHDLPWRAAKANEREKVYDAKQKLRSDDNALKELFKKCPPEQKSPLDQMTAILSYLDGLCYASIPDYDYIHENIAFASAANEFNDKTPLDWDKDHDFAGPKYKKNEEYIISALLLP
ncbi:unnamed protein product [Caenorhabditis auriculariae]|uniref:Protein kinase domain-containing protein n=1 Tax=Caenorhabditis auriculariae TaxID=2777116 RepID=A0A8S1H7W7_9PELO|nr:unnamed protein product [Caenorhabditis auriculariae]